MPAGLRTNSASLSIREFIEFDLQVGLAMMFGLLGPGCSTFTRSERRRLRDTARPSGVRLRR